MVDKSLNSITELLAVAGDNLLQRQSTEQSTQKYKTASKMTPELDSAIKALKRAQGASSSRRNPNRSLLLLSPSPSRDHSNKSRGSSMKKYIYSSMRASSPPM